MGRHARNSKVLQLCKIDSDLFFLNPELFPPSGLGSGLGYIRGYLGRGRDAPSFRSLATATAVEPGNCAASWHSGAKSYGPNRRNGGNCLAIHTQRDLVDLCRYWRLDACFSRSSNAHSIVANTLLICPSADCDHGRGNRHQCDGGDGAGFLVVLEEICKIQGGEKVAVHHNEIVVQRLDELEWPGCAQGLVLQRIADL